MGDAYVKTSDHPLIVSGEYCFFGGDPKSDEAEYLIQHLFDINESGNTAAIFAGDKPEWEKTGQKNFVRPLLQLETTWSEVKE